MTLYILTYNDQGRRNGFQSGGAKEHWKVLSATMVGRQEKFLNSKHSRMAKTVTLYIHLVDLCNKIRELIQFWQDPKNSSIVLFNLSYLSYLMEMYIKPFSYENYCHQSAIK